MLKVNNVCERKGVVKANITYDSTDYTEMDKLRASIDAEYEHQMEFERLYRSHEYSMSQEDIKILGNVIYNEARGLSTLEQSCVAWVVLNRCNKYGATIKEVATAKSQFAYYPNKQFDSDILASCEALAKDVIIRYLCEQDGFDDVGRTLPLGYIYFHGDGKANYFKTQLHATEFWDYSLPSPY